MSNDKQKLQERLNQAYATIHDTQHLLNAQELRSLIMYKSVLASQRGIKRLQRKLEVRDAYVKAAESFILIMSLDLVPTKNIEAGIAMAAFREARQNLGLVKKPHEEQ